MANAPLELSHTAKLIAAGALGFVIGFILLKSDLIWRRAVSGILGLKDGRLIKTVLLFLMIGTVGFFLLRRIGLVKMHIIEGYFWSSIMGGLFAGIGMVLCKFTPVTAAASLGCGRLYTIWTLAGMALAMPLVKYAESFLGKTVYSWDNRILTAAQPRSFLDPANPGLYIAAAAGFMIFIVHFTLGEEN